MSSYSLFDQLQAEIKRKISNVEDARKLLVEARRELREFREKVTASVGLKFGDAAADASENDTDEDGDAIEELQHHVLENQAARTNARVSFNTTHINSHHHRAFVDKGGDGQTTHDSTGHVHKIKAFVVGESNGHLHRLTVPDTSITCLPTASGSEP